MAATALEGASKYLNNLLLSRGFLKDGKAIEFPQLAGDDSTFDRNATTAQLINLVHDLILRRDRDAEQREALLSTIHDLRAEESQRIIDLQRLQDKNIQFQSELAASEAQQRTIIQSVKRSQAESKELREQLSKAKSTIDQVRAKAISDVRKRDHELDKLRNHLNGVTRGKKPIESIIVKTDLRRRNGESRSSNPEADTCLQNESNELLTALVNETTTENVALRKIVEDSLKYLRSLTGMETEPAKEEIKPEKAIGIPGQYRDRGRTEPTSADALVPVQELGTLMSQVLSHCLAILRDPSFVPIEEVQMRDEEIAKLKAGWEKMADRWKEAVVMMAQLRQRMSVIQGHNDEDEAEAVKTAEGLSAIAAFSRSIATRPSGQPVLDPIEEEELTSMMMEHYSRIGNQSHISVEAAQEDSMQIHDESLPEPDYTGTPHHPSVEIFEDREEAGILEVEARSLASPARRGITLQKSAEHLRAPLGDTNTNTRKRKSLTEKPSPRKRRSVSPAPKDAEVSFESNVEENANLASVTTNISTDPLHLETLTTGFSDDEDDVFLAEAANNSTNSRIPKLTVAQKLAAAEAEATEATEVIRQRQATTYSKDDRRAKDRLKSDKKVVVVKKTGKETNTSKDMGKHSRKDPLGKVQKARDRRRSTLTPAELGSLMGR